MVASMMAAMIPVPRWIELWEQPVSDIGADDADDQIADDSIPGAPHDLAGQPSGDDADHDDHEQALIRHFVSLVS